MQYLHTMLRIADIDQSLAFFRDGLGMQEVNRFDNADGRYTLVFLAAEQDVDRARDDFAPLIELTHNWDESDYPGGRNFGHLAFRVENIYHACQRLLDAGVVINRPPRDGHMAFVRSPDGISVELLQRGDALAAAEPWRSMPNVGSW